MTKEDDWMEPTPKPSPWFLPPRIRPNMGNQKKKYSLLPKSHIEHVLLHDNKNQNNIMEASLSHIRREHLRQSRISALHRRAFLVRQSAKQASLWERGIDDPRILPDVVVDEHLPGAKRASMESSHRRYAIALRTGGSDKRGGSKSAPLTRGDQGVRRSKSFHSGSKTGQMDTPKTTILKPKPSESPKKTRGALSARIHVDDKNDKLRYESPVQSVQSGHLPRKPHSGIKHASSMDSFDTVRSKTELPLNLTKSFTTYDTRLRREVTIADPRSMKKRQERASEDPRFKSLRTSLVAPSKPIDAMIQLSASGRTVMEKYGNSLYDYNELKDLLGHMNDTFPKREKPPVQVAEPLHVQVPVRPGHAYSLHTDYLPVKEAFVDDESLMYEPSLCDTVSIAEEE